MIIKKRIIIIATLLILYAMAGVGTWLALQEGVVEPLEPEEDPRAVPENLSGRVFLAHEYLGEHMVREDGLVRLYVIPEESSYSAKTQTNSEAMSYHLYASAVAQDKTTFDWLLDFLEMHMLHPTTGHIMWRLESDLSVVDDGSNMASDAELRAIKALLLAEDQWGDTRYTELIVTLARAVENMAVTEDGYLAPYAGVGQRNTTWTSTEVWLSYMDFPVASEMATRRGEPWQTMHGNMKQAYLQAQLPGVALYNSELTTERAFGNNIDGNGYGINSLWMMVRAAESDDPQLQRSAQRALNFYKKRWQLDNELYSLYNSNGDPLSPFDTAWVYALVGRTAVALEEEDFADALMKRLLQHQQLTGEFAGAIPEGGKNDLRVGQFTMHESLITLYAYMDSLEKSTALPRGIRNEFWDDRKPIEAYVEQEIPITEAPVNDTIEVQEETVTMQYLEKLDNVPYYSFTYVHPLHEELSFFIKDDLRKVIADDFMWILAEDRQLEWYRLKRSTETSLDSIKDGSLPLVNYIWENTTRGTAHGCFVFMEERMGRDEEYTAIQDNCIERQSRPTKVIHRYVQYDKPMLPRDWLLQFINETPVNIDHDEEYKDRDLNTNHRVDILTYEKEEENVKMMVHQQFGIPLFVEITTENGTETYEYKYLRVNSPTVSRWHPEFLNS